MFPEWKEDWMRHIDPRLDKEQAHRIRCMNLFPSMPWGECVVRTYWRNHVPDCETPYVHGVKHGVEKAWRADGKIWFEIPYVNGGRHGVAYLWHENGNLWHERHYVNGAIENEIYCL